MARTIPAATRTLLDTQLGQEYVLVLEVAWGRDLNNTAFYADRAIPGAPQVKSSVITMGRVDAAVQVSQGGQSKSVNVVLSDTDGAIKTAFDSNDTHKTPVRIWFYMMGTDFDTDKFPVFLGQMNSPIEWDEGNRTFSFGVVNRIEGVEVGFSAEEGQIVDLPEDLIGKTWPLCFGKVVNIPALKAVPSINGTLRSGVGIRDFTLSTRLALANDITCHLIPVGYKCSGRAGTGLQKCYMAWEEDESCKQSRCVEIERLKLQISEQARYEFGTIDIIGGEKFPQGFVNGSTQPNNIITLNIRGGLFTGYFNGTPDNPSITFIIRSRRHPRYDPTTGSVIVDPVKAALESACPGNPQGDDFSNWQDTISGPVWTGLKNSRLSWEAYRNAKQADFFWADGGSTVTLDSDREIVYVANILPSTILRVAAKRTINGNEFLMTVPSEFYEIRQTDFGGYQVMEIVFQRPLSVESQESGGGWSDDIFVTMESTVGPNTVDIIRWFIETYTDFAIDDTSFNATRTEIDNYPMDFPLFSRPSLLNILQDLAQFARCALWQRDDTFFIKYLSKTPTPVATITENDILQTSDNKGSLVICLTDTEDLVTKLTAEWKPDYAIDENNRSILRRNVKKYGTHDQTEFYYPFAFLELVVKSATFWLIRRANTWKRCKFLVSLKYMELEPFDAVTLDLNDVADDPVIGIVESAVLDSDHLNGGQIELEVWTPVRAGTREADLFAYPALISENALFPTAEDVAAGNAGSGTEPNFSSIAPPGHPLNPNRTPFQSITSNIGDDKGDSKPSDLDDTKPNREVGTDVDGDVSTSTSPVTNGAGYGGASNLEQQNDQNKKTSNDAERGKQFGEGGGSGSSPNSGDPGGGDPSGEGDDDPSNDGEGNETDEPFDSNDLPPCGSVEAPCIVFVEMSGFDTKAGPRPGVGAEPDVLCTPIPGTQRTETYCFGSQAAAADACNGAVNGPACSGFPPCGACISSCSITSSEGCTGDEDDGILGFNGNGGTGDPFF